MEIIGEYLVLNKNVKKLGNNLREVIWDFWV